MNQPLSTTPSSAISELRYTQYCTLCKTADTEPMSYDDWTEFDVKYLEYVKATPNPVAPHTFERFDKVNKSNPAVADLSKEVLRLTSLVLELEAQRDRAIFFKNEAESKCVALHVAMDNLRTQLSAQLDQAQRDVEIDQQESKEYLQSVSTLNRENVGLRSEVRQLRSHLEDKADRLDRLTEEGELLRSQLKTSHEDLSFVQHELTTENKSLLKEVESLNSDLTRVSQQRIDLDDENTSLLSMLNEQQFPIKRTTPANQPLYPHYYREVTDVTHIDVYWVLKAWDVVDPCVQHAIKKLMAAGMRGAKNKQKDIIEAKDSILRAIELEETK